MVVARCLLLIAVLAPLTARADLVMLRPAFQGTSAPTSDVTAGFDIVVNFLSGGISCPGGRTPTTAEAAAFAAAESTWESVISGYKDTVLSNSLTINSCIGSIDGVGGVLGSAGPQTVKYPSSGAQYLYTNTGSMTFDKADTPGLVASGAFDDVILHEMAHVIGLGTLWSSSAVAIPGYQEVYASGTGQYTGGDALAAYKSEFNQPTATFVPVELGGGTGTANAHWDEVDGGSGPTGRVSSISGQDMQFELMTGWLNSPTFISGMTIQSFSDIGYAVVPEPSAFAFLSLVSCLGLIVSRLGRAFTSWFAK